MHIPTVWRILAACCLLSGPWSRLPAADKPVGFSPTTAGEIPVEYFFRPQAVKSASLNPAGTHVAAVTQNHVKDFASLVLFNLAAGTSKGLNGKTDLNIGSCWWAGDERVVFSVVKDNHYAWGLYAAPRDDPTRVTTLNSYDAVEVLGRPRTRPDNLLLWVRQSARNEGRDQGVLEIDLRRNQKFGEPWNVRRSIPIPHLSTGVLRWFRDREGEVRYALAHNDGAIQLLRQEDDGHWTLVTIDLDADQPLAVDTDNHVLFVAHRNATGGRDLMRLNVTDGTRGPVLHGDEKYDFSQGRLYYSGSEREVVGLAYARQALAQVWFKPEDEDLQRSIDAVLPAEHLNTISSRSQDGQQLLIVSSSDRHPGSLFLLDRTTSRLKQLAEFAPWLPEKLMAPVRLMSYRTRDGLKLDGYVTLPLNRDESRPGPMIVLPHGGPWVRDTWGFDAVSQFFASRGYIVFRPNYRGSAGYNTEISKTPQFEFRKMHDDVTDGVQALVTAKIADPAHLAIVGASFGGYLALSGVAFEPGLYRCAVTIAGVFDWETMMKEDRQNENNFRAAWLRRNIGEPKQQREKFEAISPYHSVAQIKAPVFVAHGKDDTNADTGQSRRLVKALKQAGVRYEALFIPDESHGLAEMKHRVELFTRIEAFLQKNL